MQIKKIPNIGLILLLLVVPLTSFSQPQTYDTYRSQKPGDIDLTDEDRKKAETYQHKGLEQAIMAEECAGMERECAGQDVKGTFLGIPDSLVEMVGRAYSMINGMSGAPLQTRDAYHAEKLKQDPNAAKERPDYCGKIPMVGEGMAQFTQTSEQQNMQNLPGEGSTDQKKQLLKAARSHEVRSTTSMIQATVYGAASACYTGMVAMAGVQATEVAIKLPACALLTAFHTKNAIRHKKLAEKIKSIAAKLPGAGDCNPITQQRCFCKNYKVLKKLANQWEDTNAKNKKDVDAFNKKLDEGDSAFSTLNGLGQAFGFGVKRKVFYQKTITLDTMNYDKYCTTKYTQAPLADPNAQRVTCVDFKGKMDPFCECTQTDSCMDKQFITEIKGIGKAPYTEAALSDLAGLARGELRNGSIDGQDIGSYALSKNAMKKIALELPPVNLNDSQKTGAKAAEDLYGIPRQLAAHLAASKFRPSDMAQGKRMISKVRGGLRGKYRGASGKRGKNMDMMYRGGGGIKRRQALAKNAKTGPKVKTRPGGSVLKFAEEAAKQAQIHKSPERSVFQIISRRYQLVSRRGLIDLGDGLE